MPAMTRHDVSPKLRVRIKFAVHNETNGKCYLCGVSISWLTGTNDPNYGQIGHIDPDGTYTLDNLILSCRACNAYAGKTDISAYINPNRVTPDLPAQTVANAWWAGILGETDITAVGRSRSARWETY